MSVLVLQPAEGKAPGRMKQPTKDALRHWLVLAAEQNAQLRAEVEDLRAGGGQARALQDQLVADLIGAAVTLGKHETLRSSSEETIDYWRARVAELRAALSGQNHGCSSGAAEISVTQTSRTCASLVRSPMQEAA